MTMEKRKLADTREGLVHKFKVGKAKGYVRIGLFEDGRPGEVFVNMNSSTDAGVWGCIGILISQLLQRGAPLRDIVRKLAYTRFEPLGVTSSKIKHSQRGAGNLGMASSIMDYIVRWMWEVYGDGTNFMDAGDLPVEETFIDSESSEV